MREKSVDEAPLAGLGRVAHDRPSGQEVLRVLAKWERARRGGNQSGCPERGQDRPPPSTGLPSLVSLPHTSLGRQSCVPRLDRGLGQDYFSLLSLRPSERTLHPLCLHHPLEPCLRFRPPPRLYPAPAPQGPCLPSDGPQPSRFP